MNLRSWPGLSNSKFGERRRPENHVIVGHPHGVGESVRRFRVDNLGEGAANAIDGFRRRAHRRARLHLQNVFARILRLHSFPKLLVVLDTRTIVLDLSEVPAIEDGGLGMLLFLQRWASNHDIRLKLFNPRQSVRDRLEHGNSMREFDIVNIDELMALLAGADHRRSAAAAARIIAAVGRLCLLVVAGAQLSYIAPRMVLPVGPNGRQGRK